MQLSSTQELKLRLLVDGIQISNNVRKELVRIFNDSTLSLADYATTNGLGLRLDGDVWVNAPIIDYNPNFVGKSSHKLIFKDREFFAISGELCVKAEPLPLPGYHSETNEWGEPYTQYVHSHADRIRVSPIAGCAFNCHFCDMPYNLKYWKKPLDRLIDALDRGFRDSVLPVSHALISGGTPRLEDIPRQINIYDTIISHFPDYHFEIMLSPLEGLLDVPMLYGLGAKGLSINMELYSEEAMNKYSPRKIALGRKRFWDSIEKSVELFGLGAVRSLLLVGLEPMEETLKGVEELAKRGCDPVLSAFRPAPGTPLENHAPPTVDFVREVYVKSVDIVSHYPGVEMGPRCNPCRHNSVRL